MNELAAVRGQEKENSRQRTGGQMADDLELQMCGERFAVGHFEFGKGGGMEIREEHF